MPYFEYRIEHFRSDFQFIVLFYGDCGHDIESVCCEYGAQTNEIWWPQSKCYFWFDYQYNFFHNEIDEIHLTYTKTDDRQITRRLTFEECG